MALGLFDGRTRPLVSTDGLGGHFPRVVVESGTITASLSFPASLPVEGLVAVGAAVGATKPLLGGGRDGSGNAISALFDSGGRQVVAGAAASGAAVVGNPQRIGGSDGTLTRDILTDTAGRQVTVGAGAAGAALTGNPNLFAGSDGTNAVIPVIVTPADAATGAAAMRSAAHLMGFNATTWDRLRTANGASNTVGTGLFGVGPLVWDGTNWQRMGGDTSGRLFVTGPGAAGAALVGNPVVFAGSDGTNARVPTVSSAGVMNVQLTSSAGSSAMAGTPADAQAGQGALFAYAVPALFNGATYDRGRSANGAANTTGTGLAGSGVLLWDSTNWQKKLGDTSGRGIVIGGAAVGATAAGNPLQIAGVDQSTTTIKAIELDGSGAIRCRLAVGSSHAAYAATNADAITALATNTALQVTALGFISNATTFDRTRAANTAAGTTGTGLLGSGSMVFDATNWQKMAGDTSGRLFTVGPVANAAAVTAVNPLIIGGETVAGNALRAGCRLPSADAIAGNQVGAIDVNALGYGYNAATFDRLRTATGATNTTGTGLLGVGGMSFDGTNFQYLRCESSAQPNLNVAIKQAGNQASVSAPVDATAAGTGLYTIGRPANYNETDWDRQRNNTDNTVLTSASRTTTQTVTFTNYNARYLKVVLDMTVVGTGSVTVSIDGQDAISGKWINFLTGLAIITNSTNEYLIGPDIIALANVSAARFLVRNMRVVVTANNANAATYSVGRQLSV